jgi:hypothetical protein
MSAPQPPRLVRVRRSLRRGASVAACLAVLGPAASVEAEEFTVARGMGIVRDPGTRVTATGSLRLGAADGGGTGVLAARNGAVVSLAGGPNHVLDGGILDVTDATLEIADGLDVLDDGRFVATSDLVPDQAPGSILRVWDAGVIDWDPSLFLNSPVTAQPEQVEVLDGGHEGDCMVHQAPSPAPPRERDLRHVGLR